MFVISFPGSNVDIVYIKFICTVMKGTCTANSNHRKLSDLYAYSKLVLKKHQPGFISNLGLD